MRLSEVFLVEAKDDKYYARHDFNRVVADSDDEVLVKKGMIGVVVDEGSSDAGDYLDIRIPNGKVLRYWANEEERPVSDYDEFEIFWQDWWSAK